MFLLTVPVPMALVMPWWITGWRTQRAFFDLEPLRWAGGLLIALGAALLLYAVAHFAGAGAKAFPPITRIITTGPYAYTRNPMYWGVIAVMAGQGLLFGSAPALWYAVGWFVAFHVFEFAYDEPFIARKFGDEYHEYSRRVPRWMPRFRN